MILKPGTTCWREAIAPRAAVFIDMADYFKAAREAMKAARRSVHLLNWAFVAKTLFDPGPGGVGPEADRFGPFLKTLAAERPDLDVRVLCWRSSLPVAATQGFFPLSDRACFQGSAVKFRLDGRLPFGACHHQKMIIIDDALAFCGGGDIGPDRWDTALHLDDDPRREKTRADNRCFASRHEMMALVDGPPARDLGDLFRARWLRATGETLPATDGFAPDAWPAGVEPVFHKVAVGLSRSSAKWRGYPEIRENEALTLASIAQAKHCIYMENQYFTSPLVAEALARRLEEPRGPEVVLVSTQHSPSWFDQLTMDRTRSRFIERLREANAHDRLRVYSPVTTLGRTIIVHAKLTIIDDVFLRIGSSNMNNRSIGFDTECDLSLEASGAGAAATRRAINDIRTHLVAHWLGCSQARLEAAVGEARGLGKAIEALRAGGRCRLRPIEPKKLGPLSAFIATFHLGDPIQPGDSWRPWRRRAAIRSSIQALYDGRTRQARASQAG